MWNLIGRAPIILVEKGNFSVTRLKRDMKMMKLVGEIKKKVYDLNFYSKKLAMWTSPRIK